MATTLAKPLGFLMLFLLLGFLVVSARARPLNAFNENNGCLEGVIDCFSVFGVKSSGQDPRGKGHVFTTFDALGHTKISDSRFGDKGSTFTTVDPLGGITGGNGHA
ncbi:hypothetical protein QJS10_CPB13g00438 [Acorus calamus]|uniref:Uncharacterized protein n=1 Tax=Acorus calamus TaxID=4465 RepID=A0AAV9DGH3_ACOCL|nr:hypothetical protein QJS10_CPB13g00438 [Acorus calamus]